MAARKTREERKQEKELDEARKAGTIAPLTDEYGNDISPHIPQYISQTPWYIKQGDGPTLSHQRLKEPSPLSSAKTWYQRGAKKGKAVKKYRKGACTNCGAMGHQKRDCLERPRKVSVKHKAVNLAADDAEAPKLDLDYDGSRDPWNGYDANDYQTVIDKYEKMEEERRKMIKEKAENDAKEVVEVEQIPKESDPVKEKDPATVLNLPDSVSSSVQKFLTDDYEDEDEGEEHAGVALKGNEDQVGTKVDGKTRTTIRNLRIREDTAKYLLNLDPESAFYDPKTRSMRGNPLPHADPSQQEFAGENFTRNSGDTKEFQVLQAYALGASEKGQEVHMQAAPSQSELLHRDYKKKKDALRKTQQEKILEKYGGEQHLKGPDKALLLGQSERYVEYSQDGKLISGEKQIPLSKWEEDIYPGNHSSVWGSFWNNGKWGYSCCYQMEKNAYCLGDAGKKAHQMSVQLKEQRQTQANDIQHAYEEALLEKQEKSAKNKAEEEKEKQAKLQKALQEEEQRLLAPMEGDRKRKFNSGESYEVTDEEMQAYRMKRQRTGDPMADFNRDYPHLASN